MSSATISCLSRLRVQAIDIGRQFGFALYALIVAENSEGRVGEPDAVVAFDHHIVGRVQPLALETVDEDAQGAVVFGACDPARPMLAGDQPALTVARIAVGEVRRPSEHRHRAGLLFPPHDAVVGNVAPQKEAAIPEPDGPFAETHAGGEPLHRCIGDAVFQEARIEDFDRRVGVGLALPPHGTVLTRRHGSALVLHEGLERLRVIRMPA